MKKIKKALRSQWQIVKRVNTFILDPSIRKILMVWIPCTILVTQGWIVSNYLLSQAINKFAFQKSIFEGSPILFIASVIIGWLIFSRFLRFVGDIYRSRFNRRLNDKTEYQYYSGYAKLGLQDRENPEVQDAMSDANRNYSSVMDIFFTEWGVIGAIISMITSITVLGLLEWWYIPAVIAMTIPSVYFNRKRNKRTYKQQKRLNELQRYRNELIENVGTKETAINGTVDYFLEKYQSIRGKLSGMKFKLQNKFDRIAMATSLWYYFVMLLLYVDLFIKMDQGVFPIGNFFLLFGALDQLYMNLNSLLTKFVELEDEARRAKDFFLILDMTPAITDAENAIDISAEHPPVIEFDDVWFKYPGTEQFVLQGITFKIQQGERIGLVGENGEGKTTLALLLLRFYDPNRGSVRINGTDVRLITRRSLFALTGAVFQDFRLFRTRMKESIRSSDPARNEQDEVIEAAKVADIHNYIETLPDGYNQKIGRIYKGGTNLSGGQRQKFAIASLLYRRPKLMILDELTSALSPTAEDQIVGRYKEVTKGKTCLVICHRYKSLEFVDKIVVLEKGVVAEFGTHSELLLNDGPYKKMYSAATLRAV